MSRKKTFAASFLLLFIFPIMFSTYVTSDVAFLLEPASDQRIKERG